MKKLLEAAQIRRLPQYLKPQEAEFDGVVGNLLEKALSSSKHPDEALLRQILLNSGSYYPTFVSIFLVYLWFLGYFLSRSGYETFLEIITSTLASNVQLLLDGKELQMSNFEVTVHLVEAIFPSILRNDKLTKTVLPVIFNLAYLLPLALPGSAANVDVTLSQTVSKGLWESWLEETCETKRDDIVQEVVRNLGEFMMDSNIYPL
jgi:hypothetical protein